MKENGSNPIYSITPFTLLDYAHKSACILWFAGCNMRCLYCYNPEIVQGKGTISFEKALAFLHSRKNLLDAVVFSGGECLLHKNSIQLIAEVKKMGFLVKIDTNGSNPKVLEQLINENLIDYVALDFKAPKEKFKEITKSDLFQPFEKSFEFLLKNTIQFEIRTTYHSELISNSEMNEMIRYLDAKKYTGNYYVQSFKNNVATLGNLNSSVRIKETEFSSASNFNVIFRN